MVTILITGLDGSGKSTILGKLSKVKIENAFEIIHLPIIETNSLVQDLNLKKVSEFVNYLNKLADQNQIPSLKAVAIFSSMLLFKKIHQLKAKSSANTVFCERHPLIDTLVYAQFYAEKAGYGTLDKDLMAKMDKDYHWELEYLAQLIPKSCVSEPNASIGWLASFIFKRFFIDKRLKIDDLKELFEINLPDKIYYLRAKAEILYQRIVDREIHESHETLEVLRKLGIGYDELFREIKSINPGLVEIVDANELLALDEFRESILQNYKMSK